MLTCERCGCEFQQLTSVGDVETEEERKTMLAAKVNRFGPFCNLCRHLEMAYRYALLRTDIDKDVVRGIQSAQMFMPDAKGN